MNENYISCWVFNKDKYICIRNFTTRIVMKIHWSTFIYIFLRITPRHCGDFQDRILPFAIRINRFVQLCKHYKYWVADQ